MNKKNVVVLFGGVSNEHEVSKISAAAIISNISEEKYNVIPVYITKDGAWLLYDGACDNIKNIRWDKLGTQAVLSADSANGGLLRIVGEKVKTIPVDVVFPVLHGQNGEDGNIQGLLELAGIAYVGCGVTSSAIAFDKAFTKIIAKHAGLQQTPHVTFAFGEPMSAIVKAVRYKIGYPCFVKAARSGSSVGVMKANNKDELKAAVVGAFLVDRKIVIEKAVTGREFECAIIAAPNGEVKASAVGEVLSAGEDFYDYEAKYLNADSKTVIPANIPQEVSDKIREDAIKIFKAIDGASLARADFFWDEEKNAVIFNEINTMPGFTPISMYPKLWEHEGLPFEDLLDILIESAENGKP